MINGATNTVITNITVGPCSLGAVFDPSNGYVYVMNFDFKAVIVYVFNGANNTVLHPVLIGLYRFRFMQGTFGAAFDSSNGYVYVTFGSQGVSVINGANNTVVDTISVGSRPYGAAFDSSNGYVYVVNAGSGNVSVINGATNKVIANIPVGSSPQGVAFDSSNGYVFVANYNSNNVSVINGATNNVVDTVSVGLNPIGVTFDSSNGYVYVTNQGSGSVSILASPSKTTPSGSSNIELYGIIGAVITAAAIGSVVVLIRKKK